MVEFVTSPKAQIAAHVFEQVKDVLGVTAASNWMFSANSWLDGRSPIEAIREGHDTLAQLAVEKMKASKTA